MLWACRHPWAPASQAGRCLCRMTKVPLLTMKSRCCSAAFWSRFQEAFGKIPMFCVRVHCPPGHSAAIQGLRVFCTF